MKKFLVVLSAVLLCGCGRPHAITSLPSASPMAVAGQYTGVVTEMIPSTSDSDVMEITFLLPDGQYRTGSFSDTDGVSIGDDVIVSGNKIIVSPSEPTSFDEVTMPDLLAAVDEAVPGFADNHTLGNANRAADFLNMDVSDIQNAMVILPTGDDTSVLCYVVTNEVAVAVDGCEDYVSAVKATYENDPYAPASCDGACAMAENASITSGDHWALMIIAPDDQKAKLLDAISAWQESEAQHD